MRRVRREAGGLTLAGKGTSPADSSPLTCSVGDRAYQAEVSIDVATGGEGGLLLFYNDKAFVGLGLGADGIRTFEYASEQTWMKRPRPGTRMRIRMSNERNVVTFHYSNDDGATWQLHGLRMEVSRIHYNVFGGFLSLKVGLYSAGGGAARFSRFTYRALSA